MKEVFVYKVLAQHLAEVEVIDKILVQFPEGLELYRIIQIVEQCFSVAGFQSDYQARVIAKSYLVVFNILRAEIRKNILEVVVLHCLVKVVHNQTILDLLTAVFVWQDFEDASAVIGVSSLIHALFEIFGVTSVRGRDDERAVVRFQLSEVVANVVNPRDVEVESGHYFLADFLGYVLVE